MLIIMVFIKHFSCITLNLASINKAMWLTELYLILVYQNMIFEKDKNKIQIIHIFNEKTYINSCIKISFTKHLRQRNPL